MPEAKAKKSVGKTSAAKRSVAKRNLYFKKHAGKPVQPRRRGLELQSHQVILRPMVTEKGVFQANNLNQYTFRVNPQATKTEIKNAIEDLFEVAVDKVATQTRKGKPRRYKFTYGQTKSWKKAIVKLKGDAKIDFF
jgi:large subunit ribosomal protein L23